MVSFEQFWQLLYEHGSRNYYKNETFVLWEQLSPDTQQKLYDTIEKKIRAGKYVDFIPMEAIHDNMPRKRTLYRQTLTYGEYYSIYHTTEAKDGWQTEKDEEGKLIYVKQ